MVQRKITYLLIVFLCFCCSRSEKDKALEITVFAAASLTDVISEVAAQFEKEYDITVRLNLAGSGTLARQIEQGADADVYLSADKNWMDYLVEKGKTKETAVFATNDLVLVSPINRDFQFEKVDSLLVYTESKIAIGDPGYVPAGKYAMQVFGYYQVDVREKLFQTTDVRSALMMVELGEAHFGIVYKTDALQSEKVKVIFTFRNESHLPVEYYQGLISQKSLARQFYDYLCSSEAKKVMLNYSFTTD
ncbi:molybdate ABC transporter substrate-binding protein [uncultured Sunxiuqinia sp.]|uniref:molybdate ABC transporter substrate-binding protein n=1 Tax=uncultured Sunxiuqinia sp. TaxID=1573825 RepID=UPI0030DA12AB|tara:strand:- start:1865 stop:2608 length:744 start_codon:yes stop_codon:yes gene_type:complete